MRHGRLLRLLSVQNERSQSTCNRSQTSSRYCISKRRDTNRLLLAARRYLQVYKKVYETY